MIGLIVRRLLQLPIILLVIFTITLALAWALPGNPLENPDRPVPPDIEYALKQQYHLDSFWSFYGHYLYNATGARYIKERAGGDIAERRRRAIESGIEPPRRPIFDLGPSLRQRDWSVNTIIAESLPVSMTLGGLAILLAIALGLTAGILGATRPNSMLDVTTLIIALIGISLPSFVIGTALLLVFGVWLGVSPVQGLHSPWALLLPAVTLSLPFAAYIARLTRMGMIDALATDYVRTARAKGVSERNILLRHALKNAFLPVLSYLGPATALAMTGSFVVERVFSIPGLGRNFVNAVQNKDFTLIIGVVLVFSTMLILFNLVVDLLYRWIDPRIE
ncbi:MAG: ABC transporter permease [Phycisphaeraceae bacterium]|nr:ABC transporter permease [Phycisphaeraceae bacterium]MCW5753945.1 ABC transporter permease [Phycisphaeraceae bacterium]